MPHQEARADVPQQELITTERQLRSTCDAKNHYSFIWVINFNCFLYKKKRQEKKKNMFFVPVFKHAVCVTSSNGFTQKVMHLLWLSDFLLIKRST